MTQGPGETVVPRSTAQRVPVAICCAHRLYRDALASVLSARPDFVVVGDVADPADLPSLCELRAPELVLCCACDTLEWTIAALAAVRARCPRTRLILIYQKLSNTDLVASRQAGVDTLIPFTHGLDALVRVLGQARAVGLSADGASGPSPAAGSQLTDREQYIVALLAAGHPAGMIAGLLGVGTRVVENHKRRIYRKLAVSSQSHLAARAATLGLVGRPQIAADRADRASRMPLVVVHAANGPVRHDIEAALLAAHLPFVMDPAEQNSAGWSPAGAMPSILVVADPVTRDWRRSARPGTIALLVRSVPMSRDEVLAALAHGVVGVVAAAQVSAVLVPALQLAHSGHLAFEPVTGAALAATGVGWADADGVPELTVREEDILRSIARGDTVRQTARALGIAEKTVENTQSRLFRKLGARNRSGALTAAHALGLLELIGNSSYGGAAGRPARAPAKAQAQQ